MKWLTIVVPVFKVEKYVEDCLNSLLAYPGDDICVIAVDDGSPDDSGKICDAVAARDPRVTVVHQENGGVSSARNAGLALCQTEWLWFVDADDLIRPDAIQKLRASLDSLLSDCDVLMFDYGAFGGERRRAYNGQVRLLSPDEVAELRLHNVYKGKRSPVAHIQASSVCFNITRTELIRQNGITFDTKIPTGQDALFDCRMLAATARVAWLDEDLYLYRLNEGSISKRYSAHYTEYLLELFQAYRTLLGELYPGNAAFMKRYGNRVMYRVHFCLCRDFCNAQNPKPYGTRRREFMAFMDDPLIRDDLPRISEVSDSLPYKFLFLLIKMKCFPLLDLIYRAQTRK